MSYEYHEYNGHYKQNYDPVEEENSFLLLFNLKWGDFASMGEAPALSALKKAYRKFVRLFISY